MTDDNEKLEWKCPICGKPVPLKRKQDYAIAKRWNRLCKKCKHDKYLKINREAHGYTVSERTCQACGKKFQGHQKRILCDDCVLKVKQKQIRYNSHGGAKKRISRAEYFEMIKNGEIKNPMTGRSVYSVWVEKYGIEEADRRLKCQREKLKNTLSSLSEEQRHEINQKKASKGSSNGMYGRSVYDVWVEKYGVEEADRRRKEMCDKCSRHSKGKNNSMYGKPAPKGSGNGISGWYKGWYFRSLRELSYMINVIEKEGHKWRSLDNTSDFRIKYIDKNGHERSYCPDFLIDDKTIIEIKPQKLQELDEVVRKENAAILFCQTRGLTYMKIDIEIMDFSIIDKMIIEKSVVLTEKSLTKFNKYNKKHKGVNRNADQ